MKWRFKTERGIVLIAEADDEPIGGGQDILCAIYEEVYSVRRILWYGWLPKSDELLTDIMVQWNKEVMGDCVGFLSNGVVVDERNEQ